MPDVSHVSPAGSQLAGLHTPLLEALLRDPAAVADRLIALKQLLPRADVGHLASSRPQLLLADMRALASQIVQIKELLGLGDGGALDK